MDSQYKPPRRSILQYIFSVLVIVLVLMPWWLPFFYLFVLFLRRYG